MIFTKQKSINMTEGKIFPKLMLFSIPLILSSFLQLLFNAVDVVVVGKFAGDNSLAAVGSTSSLINLLVNLFVGLSVGTNVIAAQYFGAKQRNELKSTVHTAIILSFISGLILTFFGIFASKKILSFMNVPEEVLDLATVYLQIYFAGITASMVYNFGSALLKAKGDTLRPLIILFVAGLINVVLNLIFVIYFKMDVKGVALATVISQCFSAFFVIILLVKDDGDFKLSFEDLKIDKKNLIKILKVGIPAGFQGMVFSFSNVVIQSSINSFKAIVIAGSSAASNIEGFIYTAMNGFAQGTLTFTSQNLGAHKIKRIKKITIISIITVFFLGLILGNLTVLFSDSFISLYSKSDDVILAGQERLLIVCTLYFLCGIMDVLSNGIRGMGFSFLPMIISMIGACGTRILWIKILTRLNLLTSPKMIYLSYPVSWFLTLLTLLFAWILVYKKQKKLIYIPTFYDINQKK